MIKQRTQNRKIGVFSVSRLIQVVEITLNIKERKGVTEVNCERWEVLYFLLDEPLKHSHDKIDSPHKFFPARHFRYLQKVTFSY